MERTVAPQLINIYGDGFPTYPAGVIGLVFMGMGVGPTVDDVTATLI